MLTNSLVKGRSKIVWTNLQLMLQTMEKQWAIYHVNFQRMWGTCSLWTELYESDGPTETLPRAIWLKGDPLSGNRHLFKEGYS